MSFAQGTTVKTACTVKVGAALVDPTTTTLTVKKPDATTTTPAVTGTGGAYSATFVVDQPGRWVYRWTTVGNGADGAYESWFFVTTTELP